MDTQSINNVNNSNNIQLLKNRKAILLNGAEIIIPEYTLTVIEIKVFLAQYLTDETYELKLLDPTAQSPSSSSFAPPPEKPNQWRFATELFLLDQDHKILADEEEIPEGKVWVIVQDIPFEDENVWETTLWAHAFSHDINGIERAIRLMKDAGAICDTILLRLCKEESTRGEEFRGVTCKTLIKSKAYVDTCDSMGYTPLYFAAENGHYNIVNTLLQCNADPNKVSPPNTPRRLIRYDDGNNIITLNSGFQSIQDGLEKESPLIAACRRGHVSIAELLLQAHAKLKSDSKYSSKAFFYAVKNQDAPLVKLLLLYGAEVNEKDSKGYTPIMEAIQNNCIDVVDVLLCAGADINLAGPSGFSPLHIAVRQNNVEITQRLLEYGANFDKRYCGGGTALLDACGQENEKLVSLLVEYGAEVDCTDESGYTPLEIAESIGSSNIVDILRGVNGQISDATIVEDPRATVTGISIASGESFGDADQIIERLKAQYVCEFSPQNMNNDCHFFF